MTKGVVPSSPKRKTLTVLNCWETMSHSADQDKVLKDRTTGIVGGEKRNLPRIVLRKHRTVQTPTFTDVEPSPFL